MDCKKIEQSLDALDLFVQEQQKTAPQRMMQVWERRKMLLLVSDAESEIAYALKRDNDLLRQLRGPVEECGKQALQSMLESLAGMGHYFCPYCTDDKTLMLLRERLYVDVYEALQNLEG